MNKLTEVKRYNQWCAVTHGHQLGESETGSLVSFRDYESLQEKRKELEVEKSNLLYLLSIFIHAHTTGNYVPFDICQKAKQALSSPPSKAILEREKLMDEIIKGAIKALEIAMDETALPPPSYAAYNAMKIARDHLRQLDEQGKGDR